MTRLDSRSNLIASVSARIHAKIPSENGNLDTFITQFFKRAPIDFIQKMKIDELSMIVLEIWRLFQTRKHSESLVKIKEYKLSHHMVSRLGIFMVNIDQPFLIDSITHLLERHGYKIELLVHPVLGVQRTEGGKLISLVDLKEMHPVANSSEDTQLSNYSGQNARATVPDGKDETYSNKKMNTPESIAFMQLKSSTKKKQIETLEVEINKLITQVRTVVADWPLMRNQLNIICNHIDSLPENPGLPSKIERSDFIELLNWLEKDQFVFLGARYFSIKQRTRKKANRFTLEENPESARFGLFQDSIFANSDNMVPAFSQTRKIVNKEIINPFEGTFYSITKTNERSTVHRPSRIESIEVIDWNSNGNAQGVYQIIGIFTKQSYTGSAFETPIIKRKVQTVFNQFGLAPQWHDGKTLVTILNSIPRDELFYFGEEEIYTLSQNVLNMNDQYSLTLSIRPDPFGRYATIIVFLAKERYSVALKDRISKILEHYLKGKLTSHNALLGELDYARLIFVISFNKPTQVHYNKKEVERALLEASLSWEDYLERMLNAHYNEENTQALLARYQNAFPKAYIDIFKPDQAVKDIGYMEKITDHNPIDLYLYMDKQQKRLKVKIFHGRQSLSLSTLLPILNNLGLQVISETSYSVDREGYAIWIHDFEIGSEGTETWKLYHDNIITSFHHIWKGTAENDVLFQLILKVGVNVAQITILRAYLKYLRQVQLPYSYEYLAETLTKYPDLTRNLVDLFELRFNLKRSRANEQERVHLVEDIYNHLEKVVRLDHDRILRRVLNAIESTVRTNYFQTDGSGSSKYSQLKQYLSFKFDCRQLDDLPSPSPLYEVFIYSPRVEAIHLRGAKVSRGGIRWSDRPEDFRTEILGLMKAQTVKNAVIVPLGSKGGFVVKNQAKFTTRSQLMEEVIECYQMMMQGMLDITDNLIKGKIVRPHQVIRYDDDDPYLVVAADKGTAEFSDIANAISKKYNFWLDDAFASGGSEGYDHKKIAITARGVWESIKRHFREMNLDYQDSPFSVVGVGDMSGDVFGNGMLQSNQICLVAAFNHQHIFLDPNPDPEISYLERKRLFELPHSTWKDYKTNLLSPGGGIYDRTSKSIHLSPESRKLLGISYSEISPDELIKRLLCLPVDLLYFGGIGTFVKASLETHSDVGDRTNNDIRVDAKSLHARVIGEGANLAMTQKARIEYALLGGRLNTDAIDNSAGVDCSDHEVNLKILFSTMGSTVSRRERNTFLKEMTNEVANLVLADNYRQTQILTVMEAAKSADINAYQSLIRTLEAENIHVDRVLEALPDDETIDQRRIRNQGMTRPELSIMLAYAKISLYEKILNSPLPDMLEFRARFYNYFPKIIQQKYSAALNKHPLRREITATVLANEVINRIGPALVYDLAQTCGVSEVEVTKAFFLASDTLELHSIWDKIDSLDQLIIADIQTQVLLELNQLLGQIILWFLRHPKLEKHSFVRLDKLSPLIPDILSGDQKENYDMRYQGFIQLGIPADIAHVLAMIPFLPALLDIMYLGKGQHSPATVARNYFSLRSKIGLDWLIIQAAQLHVDTDWQRSARTLLIDDLAQVQVKLTNRLFAESVNKNVDAWLERNSDQFNHIRPILDNIKAAGHSDIAMISYAMRQLERII